MLYKRTIRSYEITTDGIIKINDDCYDLKERTLFFVPGTGAMRLFWFFPRRLCVKDENEKTVGYYYCGVAADSKTSSDINNFIALCYVLCEAVKHDMTRKEVETEIYNKFDVVTVEFPLRDIRREFYKIGSLPIALGVLGYALSFFAFNDPSISQSEIKLLRYLSLVCIFIGLLFALIFILKYRLPEGHPEVTLEDGEAAMRLIRSRAEEFEIDPSRIGCIGFSAGGHFCSTLLTKYTSADSRPDFGILVYPVISSAYGNANTHRMLLGERLEQDGPLWTSSNNVRPDMPPVMIIACEDDKTVPVRQVKDFYEAAVSAGVQSQLHLYPKGGHGFWMRDRYRFKKETYPMILSWIKRKKY